jgi:hypothetical protein
MTAKPTRLTHKLAIQLHLVAESCTFTVLSPGGQSGNFSIHTRMLPLDEHLMNMHIITGRGVSWPRNVSIYIFSWNLFGLSKQFSKPMQVIQVVSQIAVRNSMLN